MTEDELGFVTMGFIIILLLICFLFLENLDFKEENQELRRMLNSSNNNLDCEWTNLVVTGSDISIYHNTELFAEAKGENKSLSYLIYGCKEVPYFKGKLDDCFDDGSLLYKICEEMKNER